MQIVSYKIKVIKVMARPFTMEFEEQFLTTKKLIHPNGQGTEYIFNVFPNVVVRSLYLIKQYSWYEGYLVVQEILGRGATWQLFLKSNHTGITYI